MPPSVNVLRPSNFKERVTATCVGTKTNEIQKENLYVYEQSTSL